MFAIEPGDPGPLRSLQQLLREAHERRAEQVRAEIRQRASLGVPLDDVADWRAEVDSQLDAARTASRADVATHLRRAMAVVDDVISEPSAYQPDPRIDDLSVRIRLISKSEMLATSAALRSIAYAGDDVRQALLSAADQQRAMRRFVAIAVAEVDGLRTAGGPRPVVAVDGSLNDRDLDLLDANGLITVLFAVAREFQQLGPLELERCGLRHQSTSRASIAADAQRDCAELEDATVERRIHTSEVPNGKQIGAHVATSSTTHGSQTHCI
jgi:hypothetical protein